MIDNYPSPTCSLWDEYCSRILDLQGEKNANASSSRYSQPMPPCSTTFFILDHLKSAQKWLL